MSQRIAVVGSNSFSGSDFVDLLLDDDENEVLGVSRSPEYKDFFLPYKRRRNARFRFHQIDLNKDLKKLFEILDDFKPQYVVNFAGLTEVGPSWTNPGHWFQTNAVATANFADRLRKVSYLKKYVHISTPEVYGSCKEIKENAALNPSSPYAASQAAGDFFLFTLVKRYRFPMTMIRSTNVYGAHQQLFKIVPRAVVYIKQGRKIPLHGGGSAIKSYIHIHDVSRAELIAMKKGKLGEIYHLSPDGSISIRDLVKKICHLLKVDFTKVTQDEAERPGQDAFYIIDSAKARQEFHWKPEVSLDEGLRGVVDWVGRHWEEINKEPLEYIHKP